MSRTYTLNEMFFSLQGEGVRAGTANVFIRFSGCNLRCAVAESDKSPGGFDCDTEFEGGYKVTADRMLEMVQEIGASCKNIIFTGGEPTLQLDAELITTFHSAGYYLCIETNGTKPVPEGIDWITVSPKVAEHCLRQPVAHELKYVRGYLQALPRPLIQAQHKLISPSFNGLEIDHKSLQWCQQLVLENPEWRLSVQQHKFWKVR